MIANTFVIGAMKSATTSLCTWLSEHPDVFMAAPKEPDFFSRDEVYAKGIHWYESQFRRSGGKAVIAEGSTSYTKLLQFPQAAERLAGHVPNARLIYIVRDPVERIKSHWAHEVLKARTQLSLDEFVRTHPEAIDISCYWKQINAWRDYFDDERMLLLFTEEFRDQPAETLNQCFEFLGISRVDLTGDSGRMNATSQRKMDRWPIRMLRGQRWFDVRFEQVKQMIPQTWHPALKKLFKNNESVETGSLSDDTVKWIVDQLANDSIEFLKFCGKPNDYWASLALMPPLTCVGNDPT
ncbi:MAG: sulfotransferase family protein [Pirellulaceae bacterium]